MRMRMIKRMNYRGKGMDDKYQGIQSLSLISYFLCFGALDWCAWLNLEADSENIKKLAPCGLDWTYFGFIYIYVSFSFFG